jgi:hypothetical protein
MQGLYREISDQGIFGTDRDCRAKFVSKGRGLYQIKTDVRYYSVNTEQARLIKILLHPIFTLPLCCKYFCCSL